MRLKSDENTLKRLIIITLLFIITACTVTYLFPSAFAELAPASNSTAAAQTGSFPALTASKPVSIAEPTVQPQLSLSYVNFRDGMFFVGEPITMRVGPIRSNETGVYSVTAVITPQIGGVESSYESIASYSRDSNWFTFNFVLREVGNYTITIWQGGVMQLTREISVCNTTSTGGGSPSNPASSVVAARAAEEAARAAGTQSGSSAQTQSASSAIPSQIDLRWVIILLIVVAGSIWCLNTIVKS